MAFPVKDWKNATSSTGGGDTSTPITAAALEDLETRVTDYILAPDEPIVSTASFDASPSGTPNIGQLTIRPDSSATPDGVAQIQLVSNEQDWGVNDIKGHSLIGFFLSDAYENEDATLSVNQHWNAAHDTLEDQHIQFHTKDSGTSPVSRLEIEIGADDPYILVTTAHLEFNTDSYIKADSSRPLIILSKGSSTMLQIQMGRTADEARYGISANAGDGLGSTVAGDMFVRLDDPTKQIFLGTGNDHAAVRIGNAAGSTTPKIGFYTTAPVAKQTGVAVTAAGVHTALVNLGLISA